MTPTRSIAAVLLATAWILPAPADEIPKPDGVVYGFAYCDGVPISAEDDVLIVARAAGMDQPLAFYRMGSNPTVGDRYVLHFPYAVQEDGQTPSATSAQAGQLATVYVKLGVGQETYVADLPIPASGEVVKINLPPDAEDFTLPTELDVSAMDNCGLLCGAGAAPCGAVGLLNTGFMVGGISLMKRHYTRRRRSPP